MRTVHRNCDPPDREALRQFFAERRARPINETATLLGWTNAQVKLRAEEDDVESGDSIPWRHIAEWLMETWPLSALLDALGDDATLLPAGLHVARVSWELPFYIVQAMRVQAAIEPTPHRTQRPDTESEYIRELLHRSIDGHTIDALRHDREFMAAFAFPFGELE